MKFAIIGLDAPNTFSRKIRKSLIKLGHNAFFLSLTDIRKQYLPTVFKSKFHLTEKHPLDLREILPYDDYDMIIISHNALVFNNPKIGSTKVLYYHREMLDYPSCMNPDILAYNVPNNDRYIRQYYPPLWFSAKRIDLPIAVDPDEWNPNREKDLDGLNFVSCYEDIMEENRDYTWNHFYGVYLSRVKKYTANGCRLNGGLYVDFEEYKDYLERSEEFLNVMTPSVYYSRRLLEAAACNTLPVIHIENQESLKFHNELGFEHRENCMMFTDNLKFPSPYDWQEIAYNAYELILKHHTYDHRAKVILALLE